MKFKWIWKKWIILRFVFYCLISHFQYVTFANVFLNLILILCFCTMNKFANVTILFWFILIMIWIAFLRKRTCFITMLSVKQAFLLFTFDIFQALGLTTKPFNKISLTSRSSVSFLSYRFTETCEKTHYYAYCISFMSHMTAPWTKI